MGNPATHIDRYWRGLYRLDKIDKEIADLREQRDSTLQQLAEATQPLTLLKNRKAQRSFLLAAQKPSDRAHDLRYLPQPEPPENAEQIQAIRDRTKGYRCPGCDSPIKTASQSERRMGYEESYPENSYGPAYAETGMTTYTRAGWKSPVVVFDETLWHMHCLETFVIDNWPALPEEKQDSRLEEPQPA